MGLKEGKFGLIISSKNWSNDFSWDPIKMDVSNHPLLRIESLNHINGLKEHNGFLKKLYEPKNGDDSHKLIWNAAEMKS